MHLREMHLREMHLLVNPMDSTALVVALMDSLEISRCANNLRQTSTR
jgi:hypothetical protein